MIIQLTHMTKSTLISFILCVVIVKKSFNLEAQVSKWNTADGDIPL